jgi:putative ABC transport system ATP-binding protein
VAKNVIELLNITKIYGSSKVKTKAIDDLDLKVAEGDFISIMGPSGSGKSSLMNIIGLLDKHFKGKYLLDGIDVSKLSSNKAAQIRNEKIGFVFQQFNLLKRTSVINNVLLPTMYRYAKDDEARAIEVISRVGLLDQISKKSNELSGGQIQRVAIARALIMKPSILLADEPTGNLDTATSKEIMELFTEINSQGTTVVLITHEEEIAKYSSRTIYLRDGKIEREETR